MAKEQKSAFHTCKLVPKGLQRYLWTYTMFKITKSYQELREHYLSFYLIKINALLAELFSYISKKEIYPLHTLMRKGPELITK